MKKRIAPIETAYIPWKQMGEHTLWLTQAIAINALIQAQEEMEKRMKRLENAHQEHWVWHNFGKPVSEPKEECTIEPHKAEHYPDNSIWCTKCEKWFYPIHYQHPIKPDHTELNEKPKKGSYFMIANWGEVVESPKSGRKYKSRKAWGNCFKTRKQAELALKRVKAVYKRMELIQ